MGGKENKTERETLSHRNGGTGSPLPLGGFSFPVAHCVFDVFDPLLPGTVFFRG